MSRTVRSRDARGASLVGERYTVDVGPVAHGGHFVARYAGRVIFVRHALPGERVVVQVTEGEERSSFLRADAVSVLTASDARVEPPCPFSGPGRCGGCDFQHVALEAQRSLKASVVREQLSRLAGIDVPVVVEPAAGDDDGLRWRTRVRYAFDEHGRTGFRKHRSHEVVPVDDCLITHPSAWSVEEGAGSRPPVEGVEQVHGHPFRVAGEGFWQAHAAAPALLVDTVLTLLDPQPGERCLDLYAGAGLFTRFLAGAVGAAGAVMAVEGNRVACRDARSNLRGLSQAQVVCGRVAEVLEDPRTPDHADLVVLDPPREGAKRRVVEAVVARSPRAVAYVACDPAAMARDVSTMAEHGFRLARLRAFDLFPMTHHVECVALLERTGSDLR